MQNEEAPIITNWWSNGRTSDNKKSDHGSTSFLTNILEIRLSSSGEWNARVKRQPNYSSPVEVSIEEEMAAEGDPSPPGSARLSWRGVPGCEGSRWFAASDDGSSLQHPSSCSLWQCLCSTHLRQWAGEAHQ